MPTGEKNNDISPAKGGVTGGHNAHPTPPNIASTGGSRFAPLTTEEAAENVPEALTLATTLKDIPDDGPNIRFNASTKEQAAKTKERKGKGVQLKEPGRIGVNPPRTQRDALALGPNRNIDASQ